MDKLSVLLESYSENNSENFSFDESLAAINEGLTSIDDMLSDSSGDCGSTMIIVFSTVEYIFRLCRLSPNLTPQSLTVWKRYIPLLKHSVPANVEIISRISDHLIDSCLDILISLAPIMSTLHRTGILSQNDLDAAGMILFYNQRLCATLAYFAGVLPETTVMDYFSILLYFHGMIVHANNVCDGSTTVFVEKHGESLLKSCTLRQSEGIQDELFCYYEIKKMIQNILNSEDESRLRARQFVSADDNVPFILIGTQHLMILYLRYLKFFVECLTSTVELLTEPTATMWLMLDIYLECSAILNSCYCGVVSDQLMMSSLQEVMVLIMHICSLLDSKANSEGNVAVESYFEAMMNVLIQHTAAVYPECDDTLQPYTRPPCEVVCQLRCHYARLLLTGLLNNCETDVQVAMCQVIWNHFVCALKVEISGVTTPFLCGVAMIRALLLTLSVESRTYITQQVLNIIHSPSGCSVRVEAMCVLLKELPLRCLVNIQPGQRLISAALVSVVESPESLSNSSAVPIMKREFALSVLSSLASEGVTYRQQLQRGAVEGIVDASLFEQVLSKYTVDVSLGTCVVNWLNVLNEYQSQSVNKLNALSASKMTISGREIIQRKLGRLVIVLPVIQLLVSLLSAHKLPKGVVNVLVEVAVCCVNSIVSFVQFHCCGASNIDFVNDNKDNILNGLKAVLDAMSLVVGSSVMNNEMVKKLQNTLMSLQSVSVKLDVFPEPFVWEAGCLIQLSLPSLCNTLRIHCTSLPECRQLIQLCHNILKPVSNVSCCSRDVVKSHLLSFKCITMNKSELSNKCETSETIDSAVSFDGANKRPRI